MTISKTTYELPVQCYRAAAALRDAGEKQAAVVVVQQHGAPVRPCLTIEIDDF